MTAFDTQIARIAHEVNRAYCAALGDLSQKPWEEAPDWQRQSAIAGVRFLIDNPNAGPDASHKAWLAHKEAEGWKYGPVKDEAKKEHPCFTSYENLPEWQRVKDYLFGGVVRVLLSAHLQPVELSPTAADAIRYSFNPSSRGDVAAIKSLTGTLITLLEGIRDRDGGKAGREAAVAITHVQTASMWAVLAATKGL